MRIIFDLDGTLLDSSERMYRLFINLVPNAKITKEEYWNFKRDKVNHQELLKLICPKESFDSFNEKWLSLIETDYYLQMDSLYIDTIDTLDSLKEEHTLWLLTARQSKEQLFAELVKMGLLGYFEKILITEQKCSKKELLTEASKVSALNNRERVYFVSDMGSDIETGNEMGFETVAITHGFMSRQNLLKYGPKYVIKDLLEMRGIL